MLRLYNILKSFSDYQGSDLDLTEQELIEYQGKAVNLYHKVSKQTEKQTVSVLNDVDFSLDLMHHDKINVAYILRKCLELKKVPESEFDKKRKEIKDLLDSSFELYSKRELIEKFIEQNLPKLSMDDDIHAVFADFKNKEASGALSKLCEEEKLAPEKIQKLMQEYIFADRFPKSNDIKEAFTIKISVLKMKTVMEAVTQKIREFIDTYVDGFEE